MRRERKDLIDRIMWSMFNITLDLEDICPWCHSRNRIATVQGRHGGPINVLAASCQACQVRFTMRFTSVEDFEPRVTHYQRSRS